jgi:hypothetical protein
MEIFIIFLIGVAGVLAHEYVLYMERKDESEVKQ